MAGSTGAHAVTEIIANEMQMLDTRGGAQGGAPKGGQQQNRVGVSHNNHNSKHLCSRAAQYQPQSAPQAPKSQPAPQQQYNEPPMDFDDDIPF